MRKISRKAFTLVELMVAMALTIFIMLILTQAFMYGLETFTQLKAIGDMQAELRSAQTIIRDDLAQDHFEGKRRLSDVDTRRVPQFVAEPFQAGFFAVMHGTGNSRQTWTVGASYAVNDAVNIGPAATPYVCIQAHVATAGNAPPNATFWSPNAPYVFEGVDSNNQPSFRATDHVLYMTVKRKGNKREAFFTANLTGGPTVLTPFFSKKTAYNLRVPNAFPAPPAQQNPLPDLTMTDPYNGGQNGFYSSQWAEVIYYLKRTGSTEEPNNPTSNIGTPIFELFRAQFVMVPDGTELRTPLPTAWISGASYVGGDAVFLAGVVYVCIQPHVSAIGNAPPNPAFWAASTNVFVGGNLATYDQWSKTNFAQMSCGVTAGVTVPRLLFLSPDDAARGGMRMLANSGNALSVSVVGSGGLSTFNPQALVRNAPTNRVTLTEAPVLQNVISFQVQVMRHDDIAFGDILPTNIPPIPTTPGFVPRARIFDTTYFGSVPGYSNNYGIKAIQITLRVWEQKTRQTRQVTLVQDM